MNGTNTVEELRNSRKKPAVIYTKFLDDKKNFPNKYFLFFEGEDYKYYLVRIEEHLHIDYEQHSHYSCGGKSGVLKVRQLIDRDEYHDTKKLFFIDKDFSDENIYSDEIDIYQTPCYSIENLYTSKKSFEKMLVSEFGLSSSDEDFVKCSNDYSLRIKEFHNYVYDINIWIYLQRKHEKEGASSRVKLDDFRINKFFNKIGIERITCVKALTKAFMEESFPDALVINESEFMEARQFCKKLDHCYFFRGKYEMVFLKEIIRDLVLKNKHGEYFSYKRECVSLQVNTNELSVLSTYADTPDCLIDFFHKYKESITC